MKKAKQIARYLVENDVDVENSGMNEICARFGAEYEDIRAELAEAYDVAMTELGVF